MARGSGDGDVKEEDDEEKPRPGSSELWTRLHTHLPAKEKIVLARQLLHDRGSNRATSDSRHTVWLFEWFSGSDGLLGKKAQLPPAGLDLLCELLEALPADYPLGSQVPALVAQIGAALKACGISSGETALPEREEEDRKLAGHSRLMSLLRRRSALSFRLTPEQAAPLLTAAVEALERRARSAVANDNADDGENDAAESAVVAWGPLPDLVAGTARLLERALELAVGKKAFRGLVEALPAMARLLEHAPPEDWRSESTAGTNTTALEERTPQETEAGTVAGGWPAALAAIRALLDHLFDRRHLEGFEALARTPDKQLASLLAEVKEPAKKKARKGAGKDADADVAAGEHSVITVYQADLFRCITDMIQKSRSPQGCSMLLPALLDGFLIEHRKLVAYRAVLAQSSLDGSGHSSSKVGASVQELPELPIEFWFFRQLSRPLRPQIKARSPAGDGTVGTEEDKALPLVRCFVDLWRLVRTRNVYRPREDPKGIQAKSLRSLCALLLERLGKCGSASAARALPEWEGLIEALRLDAAPFEERLDQLWARIGDLCPKAAAKTDGANGLDDASKEATSEHPCLLLAGELLGTYARLADLPACMAALAGSFREGPARRARRLLADAYFQRSLAVVAGDVSAGSSSSQTAAVWQALLDELRPPAEVDAAASEPAASPAWWAASLLWHFILGLQAAELTLESLRSLLVRTFGLLGKDNAVAQQLPVGTRNGLCYAACRFGRQILSWELPPYLHKPDGESATLALEVAKGLETLSNSLIVGDATDSEELQICIEASVEWLALHEQDRTCTGVAAQTHKKVSKGGAPPRKVVARLLELAEDPSCSDEIRHSVREVVCCWAPLFAAQVVRSSRGESENAVLDNLKVEVSDQEQAAGLMQILIPSEPSCWSHLASVWSAEGQPLSGQRSAAFTSDAEDGQQSWAPAARLWARQSETVLEPSPPLHDSVLQRFSSLIEEAVASSPTKQKKEGRKVKRQLSTLAGLHLALRTVTSAPLRGASPDVVAAAVRAVVATLFLACSSVAGSPDEPAVCLLAVSLKCLAGLIELLAMDQSAVEAAQQIVASIVGAAAFELQPDGKPPSGEMAQGAIMVAASVLGKRMLGDNAAIAATEALAIVVRSLFRLRFSVLPEAPRRAWAATVVSRLVEGGLKLAHRNARVLLRLPDVQDLLSAKLEDDDCATDVEPASAALALLLAVLRGSAAAKDASSTPSLAQGLRVVVRAAGEPGSETGRGATSTSASRRRCAARALAVMARGVELGEHAPVLEQALEVSSGTPSKGAKRAKTKHGDDEGNGKIDGPPAEDAASMRRRLASTASSVVAQVAATSASSGEGCEAEGAAAELRSATSDLVQALSAQWRDGDDDEHWRRFWVPTVVRWTETMADADSPMRPSGSRTAPAAASTSAGTLRLAGASADADVSASGSLCAGALCAGAERDRREWVVELLSDRVSELAARDVNDPSVRAIAPLLGTAGALAAVLRTLPLSPPLRARIAGRVTIAARALLTVASLGVSEVALILRASEVAEALYAHLAERAQKPGRAPRDPHFKLAEAESLLLHVAGMAARTALGWRLLPGNMGGDASSKTSSSSSSSSLAAGAEAYSRLLASSYGLLSLLFSSVPIEGRKLPTWTEKPHILIGIMKLMLEAVYAAPSGAKAAAVAADTTRLWEAFALGGTRMVARSAGRSGQSIFQAKVQRATQGFGIMIIAHSLEQQRLWPGVDAASQRCIAEGLGATPRAVEEASWREVPSLVQTGLQALLGGLEGAEHLKQGLYASLREPLSTMFKELHEGFQQRGRYRGEA
eukprot:TRINITY_DN8089_c0_g2_i3.p1 TRINITY_DN8089_c0_g2~~TRINITY_DN8089_c0_g2_i3.p1  ORF type:complete len:1808 (-),score=351.14 TRINITY_DN8089_c0_g2_i3:13-5436(-)